MEEFPILPLGNNAPKLKPRPPSRTLRESRDVKRPKDETGSLSQDPVICRRPGSLSLDPVPTSDSEESKKFNEAVQGTICNFYGLNEQDEELNVLPAEEPEFYEVETTLDTGASTHAADRVDFPGYEVVESPGSRAGQLFGCAGGKSLQNEGQITVNMISPIEGTEIRLCTQVTKVTRPLLSVTKLTEEGKLRVLCDQVKAVVMDLQNKVLATFPKKNGLYVCTMKVRNPRYKDKEPFPRPLP